MKAALLITLLFQLSSYGQSFKEYEKKLNSLSDTRNYWENQKYENNKNLEVLDPYDSLELYNDKFEKMLLEVTHKFPESMAAKFETLQKNNIRILTSADGNFRIYNWDTNEGGTMHFFKNILQYKSNEKIKAKVFNTDDEDPGCSFFQLAQLTSQGKHYYLACTVSVGSSAVFSYEAKVFSIDNGTLNEDAKLIKTQSGLKNSVGYEIDFSNEANRNDTYFDQHNLSKYDYVRMEYDPNTKTITFPLLDENEKLTTKKIRYRFNGTYFEKIKKP